MLLSHWEKRREEKYFLFGIGTDFQKIKYPFVWYDILHVLDVLSRFQSAIEDQRFYEMLTALLDQAGKGGRYTASSMYRAWKGWSFADKKILLPGYPSWFIEFRSEPTARHSPGAFKQLTNSQSHHT